jgi:lipoprotein-anchoring transpeptidase ErfK/SrfK
MPVKDNRSAYVGNRGRAGQPTALWSPAPERPGSGRRALVWLLFLALFLLVVVAGVLAGGLAYVYARGRVIPGVSALGVPLSGRTADEAAAALQARWDEQTVALQNGELSWPVKPVELGMTLDAAATARSALDKGRSLGGWRALPAERAAWFRVAPVWRYDPVVAERTLAALAPQLAVAPVNAGIDVVDGRAVAIPAIEGRELDLTAALAALQADPGRVLSEGRLALAVRPVPAAVQDVSAAVDEANRLLATTVTLEAYDPVRDERFNWPVEPRVWSEWLTLSVDPTGATPGETPYTWALDKQIAAAFLDTLEAEMGDGRYLDEEAAPAALSAAIRTQQPAAVTRVYHPERRHTVQSGETLSSIGYDYGMPYPWIQQANPGVESLSVGQEIVIPSPDVLLPLPPAPNKRIVVNMTEQRTRVYENGALKWDWPASTGIASSPTAPGVFQIQSHEPNAYAGNWDLWMPSFMGIYRPVPTSDFMNGFHGFPTRGNAQLLWTGDLGHRVTYGCILLSSENAELLYQWAEEGVVVEVQR